MDTLRTLANPFQFSDLDVRTAIDEHNEAWFCARDVCLALEITWSGGSKTLGNMPETWVMAFYEKTIKGNRETIFINEAALYKMIFRSNKPKAEEFANWVCAEVLPQLRKTGSYGVLPTKDYIAIVKQIADLTERLISSKNAFNRKMLLKPLQNLCNMAGQPMP